MGKQRKFENIEEIVDVNLSDEKSEDEIIQEVIDTAIIIDDIFTNIILF